MRKTLLSMALIISVLFIMTTVNITWAATLYRWVDEKGVVHVSETPPEGKENVAQTVVGEETDKAPKDSEEKKVFRVRPGEVIIYTTPTCPWCHRTKAWMRDKKVRYKEIDITTDKKGLEEMVRISGQTGVPVIVIGDEVIVGFNEKRLNEIFKN